MWCSCVFCVCCSLGLVVLGLLVWGGLFVGGVSYAGLLLGCGSLFFCGFLCAGLFFSLVCDFGDGEFWLGEVHWGWACCFIWVLGELLSVVIGAGLGCSLCSCDGEWLLLWLLLCV